MKNIKMNLVMLGVGLMSIGALTSCGGGDANKKYAEQALDRISGLAADFATVSGQIQSPHMIVIPDEKDSSIRHEIIITWEYLENQWSANVDEGDNITYLTPTLPGADEQPVDFTITAIATLQSASARKVFEGTLLPTEAGSTQPISAVYSAERTGAPIVVQGVARDARTANGYVVCDSTGCTYVYDTANAARVVAGTTIKVTGTIAENPKTVGEKSVGLRQIDDVSNLEVISTEKINTIPQGSHISDLTIDQYLALNKDVNSVDFKSLAGKVYKTKGYLITYDGGSHVIYELVAVNGTTSPYLAFYANTSNTDVKNGLAGFYGSLVDQYVEATYMIYDCKIVSNAITSWRPICLDIVATAEPTAA